ncbi:unnamed protein product [Tetraodon nigroviridis]|uniref:(spotted green pufferfish) hypothetical protein n=1 Tax=Tetraodon nigroviridis TaxID=99883 RepID=Q4SN25_TETNG|nr:unnamed protein product [Tetraodon nigroviridis]
MHRPAPGSTLFLPLALWIFNHASRAYGALPTARKLLTLIFFAPHPPRPPPFLGGTWGESRVRVDCRANARLEQRRRRRSRRVSRRGCSYVHDRGSPGLRGVFRIPASDKVEELVDL